VGQILIVIEGIYRRNWRFDQLVELAVVHWERLKRHLFPRERSSSVHFCPSMLEFSDLISEQCLMDLPLVVGLLRGLTIWTSLFGQGSIGFLFPWIGKLSFMIYFKK
jgi:hypothetical protein